MPHIKQEHRDLFKDYRKAVETLPFILEKGDLEYLIYYLLGAFMDQRDLNYHNLHDAVYAAVHAGEEFKRNHLDKREKEAMQKNGEAYFNDERIED